MGYPFGKAPQADGTGTEPEDVQQVLWAIFRANSASLVRGGVVEGTSSMAYSVAPAVLLIPTGDSRRILVPTDRVTVPTPTAPSSGSRTDYIYAGENGAVVVGTSHPAGTALLDKRTVPAGISATTATTSLLGDRKFAPLFGGTMGRLISWVEGLPHQSAIGAAWATVMSKTITVESDRLVDFRFFQTVALQTMVGGEWSSMQWEVLIDGAIMWSWEMKVEAVAETKYFNANRGLTEGTHTVQLRRRIKVNSGKPVLYYGANGWPGTNFTAIDLGALA